MPRRPRSKAPADVSALTADPDEPERGTAAYYRNLTAKYPRLRKLQRLDPDIPPWEQQPGETQQQYAYFRLFLETPPHQRSARAVAAASDRDRGYIQQLSHNRLWVERVGAWDEEQRRLYQLELEKRRAEVVARHLRVSDAMLDVVLRRMADMNPREITARDLGQFVAAAGDLARKALGMDNQQPARVNVGVAAVAQASADAEASIEQPARIMAENILDQMQVMAAAMTPEQVAEAQASWEAFALPAAEPEPAP